MADPFEVRMRFSSLLQHLTASSTAALKAASYALKHREMDEDLHSCILEQLERDTNSMNNKANIMYFIEVLCEASSREGHMEYVRMVQRDVLRVVDSVAPEDGSGRQNVGVVRTVLQALQAKRVLMPETVTELEALLKARDIAPSHPFIAEAANDTTQNGGQRLDKRQVEQRIEEDRERHKRLRENIWAVPGEGDAEMERLWEEASDIGDDDWEACKEDLGERRQGIEFG